MSDIAEEVNELVEEAKKPGIFKIVDVVKDRGYPRETVNVYVNETVAYELAKLKEESATAELDAEEYEALQAKIDEKLDELSKSRVEFTLTGIPEGKREKLHAECVKEFPVEYIENTSIFAAEGSQKEVENKERDDKFTNMLWSAHIVKVTNSEGDFQEGISVEEAEALREDLPLAASAAINDAIEKLRVATAVFLMKVDEDFLAKS